MKNNRFNVKLNSGANFSSLARNGSRFLHKQTSEVADNISEGSLARSKDRKSSQKKRNMSPNWMNPGRSGKSAARSMSSQSSRRSKSRIGKISKNPGGKSVNSKSIKDGKTEDTCTSFSKNKVDAQIERALRLHNNRIKDEKDQIQMDSISLFSKERSVNPTPSTNNMFKSDLTNINFPKDESDFGSFIPPQDDDEMRSQNIRYNELSFKDEQFGSAKVDLNKSSPVKDPRGNLGISQEGIEGVILHEEVSNNEFISVDGDFQELNCEQYELNLEENKSTYERMTDFSKSKKSPNKIGRAHV